MRRLFVLLGLIVGLALPVAALAAANDQMNVVVAKGDNQPGNYYVAAQSVTINGDVAGDVVCGGQTVTINGSVGGDVLCGAQSLTVNGPVAGSVRAGGQLVIINGTVGRNVTVAAQNFTLGTGAKVGGDLVLGASIAVVGAPVTQSLYAAAENLTLNSTVGGNVTARVGSLTMGEGAAVSGNMDYTSSQTLPVDKSKVNGQVVHHAPAQPANAATTLGARLGMLLYWLVASLLGMLLAIWLAPRLVRSVTGTMLQRWQASLGWGALVLIAGPAVVFVVALTVVGLPIALVALNLWLLALLSAGLFAGVAIGRLAFKTEDVNRRGMAMAALVGIPLVVIAGWLPWIGVLVGIVGAAWTFGGMALALNRARSLS